MSDYPKASFRFLTWTDLDVLNNRFPQPTPTSHDKRLQKQDKGSASYVCAELENAVVAIQLIRWKGPQNKADRLLSTLPEVGSLYTLPQYRGKGIGAALVRYSENMISDKGYSGVGAIIKDNNDISIAMHLKDGYQKIGEASRTKQHPDLSRSYYIKLFAQ